MEFIIVLLIILIYSTMQTIIFKKRIEQTIPISIVEIVLIIYLAGLFDNLKIGITIVEIIAIIQLLTILFIICKQKEKDVVIQIFKRIITPGLFVYISIYCISIYINKGRIFEDYDEFNHWARIIKNMFIYNTYGTNSESIVVFNEYPPFTAIFQYIFLGIKNIYSEDVIIIAQNILFLSIIIPITKKFKWNKEIKNLIIILPLVMLVPMIFYKNFYLDILVDGLLGVMFAFVVFTCYEEEENKIFKNFKILYGEIMLCLTKTSGIGLAILAIIIYFIKILFDYKKQKIDLKKNIINIITIIFVTTIITSIWYIKVNDAKKRWDFNQYIEIENNKIEEMQEIAIKFKDAVIWKQTITDKKLTVLVTTLILICTNIYIIKKAKDKQNYKYYSIAILISIPIYLIFLLITYMTIFENSEASELTCFDRYCSTILLAVAMFQIMVLSEIEIKADIKNIVIIYTILLCVLPQENIVQKYIYAKNYITNSSIRRDVYTKITNYKNRIDTNDKILYISGTEGNAEYLLSLNQYELMPLKIEDYNLGNFSNEKNFENILKNNNYTHIFIYRMDDEVKERIKSFFKYEYIQNDTLYKIITNENKICLEMER